MVARDEGADHQCLIGRGILSESRQRQLLRHEVVDERIHGRAVPGVEDAGSKVTVQALCPGFTYTEFHDVMGVDRAQVASWLWMKADDVVDASLAALRSRKLYVIPGWKYRVFVALATKLPAALRLRMEASSPHTKSRM